MAVNKLLKVDLFSLDAEQPRYEVTIKDKRTGETLYQVESFAGVIASMETTPEMYEEVNMQGAKDVAVVARMQKLAWGHPMLALTCLDQLKEAIRPHLEKIRKFVSQTLHTDVQTP